MKTVYFVRHAKSSWANSNMSAHERPLNERGERDAPDMGQRLRRRELRPEMIIASSAVRAKTTAEIIAAEIEYPESEIIIDERLYEAEPDDILNILSDLQSPVSCVMLVGCRSACCVHAQHASPERATMRATCGGEHK